MGNDVVLHRRKRLDFHTNGMVFEAFDAGGTRLERREYYSVGGGFVLDEDETGTHVLVADPTPVPHPFNSGAELLRLTTETGSSVSDLMLANEKVWRSEADIRTGLLHIWKVMQECVERGVASTTRASSPTRSTVPVASPAAQRGRCSGSRANV